MRTLFTIFTVFTLLVFLSFSAASQTITQILGTPVTGATWTVPCGVTSISVQVRGGGGGGGSASQGAGGTYGGGGGGGGGYTEAVLTVTPGQTFTYTVGAGGAGSSTNANGGNGGASVFGTLVANGGTGGTSNFSASSSVSGGTGGTASGGAVNLTGANGNPGTTSSSGAGGGCGPFLAGGAAAITVPRTNGASGINGGGGSGGFTNQNPRWNGGDGGNGQIVITYIGANAGPDRTYPCLTASINLEGIAPITGIGTWTKVSGAGTIVSPNSPNSAVTGLVAGACSVFRWTWSGTGCPSTFDDVTICVDGTSNCFDEPCTAEEITVSTSGCAYITASTVGSTPSVSYPDPGCGLFNTSTTNDVWYRVTVPPSGVVTLQGVDAPGGGNFLLGMAVYRGQCHNLRHAGCVSTSSTSTPATHTVTGTPGETLYVRIWNRSNTFDSFQFCATSHNNPPGGILPGNNTITCGSTQAFFDPGGSTGNYLPNTSAYYEICANVPWGYVSVTFSSLGLGTGDRIVVLNGSQEHAPIIGLITSSTTAPYTVTSSYPGGCLQFFFLSNSDASVGSGWQATVECAYTPGTNPGANIYDLNANTYLNSVNCNALGGVFVCGDGNVGLTNNNGGIGTNIIQELGIQTAGCLVENGYTGEFTNAGGNTASYWIYFQAITSGILTMSFTGPGGQNYDFAVYGPSTNYTVPCPLGTGLGPIRCSNTTNNTGGVTGMGNGATDYFENQNGDGWVAPLNVVAGETYAMLLNIVQNGTPNPVVNLDVGGTATLDCDPTIIILDVNLVAFEGINQGNRNLISWITTKENRNDYFTLHKSKDGLDWQVLGTVKGKGTTEEAHYYQMIDNEPISPVTYYRLQYTDFDGKSGFSKVIAVRSEAEGFNLFTSLYPNPAENEISFRYAGAEFKETMQICIYNALGKLISCNEYKVLEAGQIFTLDTLKLPNGLYHLVATQGNVQTAGKFVICK